MLDAGRRLFGFGSEAKESTVGIALTVALNAAFGWSWADPLAALAIVPLLVREGLEGSRGEREC